jgi:NAD(P) transhydrogenase subunit alpha
MEEILDYEDKEKTTNYRKWAFRFLIYLVLLFAIGFYLFPSNLKASEFGDLQQKFFILGWILKIFLCIGIFFTIMMIRNNETRDYKYWISLFGISFFFVATVVFNFIYKKLKIHIFIMEELISFFNENKEFIYVIILSIFLGVEVISNVPAILHTPLMSGANAIHGVVIIGAIIVMGHASPDNILAIGLGFVAVVLGTLNVVGGFVVTNRMLEMFKKKK